MIIVYGGCQADEPERPTPQLPSAAAEDLFVRIRGLLNSLAPQRLVGALASGGDILFARAALAEGIPLQITLPFDVETFCRTSVKPAGEPWTSHYDRITTTAGVNIDDGGLDPADADVYRNTRSLLAKAESLWTRSGSKSLGPRRAVPQPNRFSPSCD